MRAISYRSSPLQNAAQKRPFRMSSYEVRQTAVIGAGNMGSGIAQKIATEGLPVILVDLDDEKVQRGMQIIKTTLDQGVQRKLFRPEQVAKILEGIEGTSDWSNLERADLVIEAVFEDLEVKKKVFQRLGEVTRPTAILGTNTSSFYVKDLCEVTTHPERLVGLHYFYHPAKNRLVEVIGHAGSAPEAVQAAWSAQEAIGKTPIASADAPGFVVNRYFVPWLTESVKLLETGVADIPTIEWAAKKAFRIGMGPFELMNVTGVPIALHAADTLGRELHDFYTPPQTLRTQVESGKNWDLEGAADESKYEAIADHLLGTVFYVAAQLVDEGVATVEDTDIGARVGLRWSKGPFQLMNRVGIQKAVAMARKVVQPYGLEVPELLTQANPATGIPIHLVSLGERSGMTSVWVDRPDAMNALNEEVVTQLESVLQEAKGRDQTIMIGGSGKAFIAGADIKFFVDNLKANTFPRIYDFTAKGQELLRGLSGGPKAVVARAQGLTLGGGCELALACDWIAASPKASFAFPETGIGIYPGLGGTQRLQRRVGLPIAKYLVYTGNFLGAQAALEIGLIDALADFSHLDATCRELAGRGASNRSSIPTEPVSPSWLPVWEFFDRFSVDQILSGQGETKDNPVLEKAVKKMQTKSFHALRLAELLFNEGSELSLDDGLQLELKHLEEVFSNPDALEGLSSLIEGRRPEFAVS